MRELYFTAQYYHLVHSVALLGVPLVPRPKIVNYLNIVYNGSADQSFPDILYKFILFDTN